MVIDLFGLTVEDVRLRFPEVYQHVLSTVKRDRDHQCRSSSTADSKAYANRWWIFEKPRPELRSALEGLPRYIATTETAKHRFFEFLPAKIMPDNMLVCVAENDAFVLGVLSSRVHIARPLMRGGTLEDRPRYTKSLCFDCFPFPSPSEPLKAQIGDIAEELDSFRKQRQQENPSLTLTQRYNALERMSTAVPILAEDEERIKQDGLVLILKELHGKLDRLVFQAYGWPETLSDEGILAKLVELNHERAAEERRGHVRWLRPEYQVPRFAKDVDSQAAKEEGGQIVADLGLPEPVARKPSFPADPIGQTALIFTALTSATGPTDAASIGAPFRRTKTLEQTISNVLASLARLGHVTTRDGKTFEIRHAA